MRNCKSVLQSDGEEGWCTGFQKIQGPSQGLILLGGTVPIWKLYFEMLFTLKLCVYICVWMINNLVMFTVNYLDDVKIKKILNVFLNISKEFHY